MTHNLSADGALISHQGFDFSDGALTDIPAPYAILYTRPSAVSPVPVAVSSLYFPRISGQEGSECIEHIPHLLLSRTDKALCGLPNEYLVASEVKREMQPYVPHAITDTRGFLIRYRGKFSHFQSTAGVHSSN